MLLRRTREKLGPIAVDVGERGVKIAQLARREGDLFIVAATRLTPPPGANADTPSRSWMAPKLREALRSHDFIGRSAVSALGPGEFEPKNIRLPPMPPEELSGAASFEAQERFGLTAEQAQFRHLVAGQVRQGTELREEVVVLAARNEAIQARIALLEAAELEPTGLDIAPCAMARSFVRFLRRREDAAAVNVFLDVGWRSTALTITRGPEVCFVKMFDVGGVAFTRAVAQRLVMSEAEAWQLRRRIVAQATGHQKDVPGDVPADLVESVADAVRPAAEQLARDVQLTLRYFSVTFRGQRPSCITFVGGEAHEPALIPTVGAGLDIPCTVGDPLRGIVGTGALHDRSGRSYRPAWAVAIGLALRGLGTGAAAGSTAAPHAAVGAMSPAAVEARG